MHLRSSAGIRAMLVALVCATPALAEVKVILSGGFAPVYREVLPEFQRTTGITVTSASGASQGNGPETIGAQLRRGTTADVVILSREGLNELIAQGRIAPGTDIDLAETPVGAGVRAGAPKPDITTVVAFIQTLLKAKTVAVPGSTTGIYLTTDVFPRLGLADKITVKITPRGTDSTAMVAAGDAAIALQPVSELLHVSGVDFVGPIPKEIQFVSVFAAAIVAGSKEVEEARRLIAFLASGSAVAAMRKSGMEPSQTAGRN